MMITSGSTRGVNSRQNTLNSEDDAEYEEDDEIADNNYSQSEQNDIRNLRHGVAGSHQESDQEDVEMTMDPREANAHKLPTQIDKEINRKREHTRRRERNSRFKRHPRRAKLEKGKVDSGSDVDMDSVASLAEDDEDEESKKSTDSEVDDRWQSEGEDDDEIMNPNCCIYCHQDEEHDPSEEFELYLSCGVCGDNAHRQCARDANALRPEDEGNMWYCPECVSNDLVRSIPMKENPNQPSRTVIPKKSTVEKLTIQRDDQKHKSRSWTIKKNSPCVDTETADKRVPRRRARHLECGSRLIKNATLDKDVIGSDQNESDAANIHSEQDAENQTKILDTISEAKIVRSLRPKSSLQPQAHATILEKSANTFKIAIKVDPVAIRNRLSYPLKPKERKKSSTFVPSTPSNYPHPFYLLHDREAEELKSKPYGGILTEKEADTSLTLPKPEHRRLFDEARQKAEEDWKARTTAAAVSSVKKPRKVSGPASQIEYIEFGDFQIDVWYAAPYPEEYSRNKALFICEFCLKYMESDIVAWRHTTKCPWKNPPGDEIYRDGQVAVFEVDGRKNPLYCQNLCLLAKLFLGSKTLYYDVEPFLFYVMTEYDKYGCHFVGYFSKEKRPSSLNNVSCILVLPIHQRKGYGHLLIDFSYLLTRVEKKTGSPEKPLSDMGLVSYRSYWRLVLCTYLKDFKSGDKIPSIRKISSDMGLSPDDVISALDALGALIRDPITGTYAIKVRPDYYRQVIKNHESKNYVKLNPDALFWTPYVMGRWNVSKFDYTPSIEAMTQQDEKDENQIGMQPLSPGHKRDYRSFSEPHSQPGTASGSLQTLYPDQSNKMELCDESQSQSQLNTTANKPSYYEAAASIPPTRFEVFPPPPGSRARATTARPSSARPTPARQKSSPSTGARSTSRRVDAASRCTPCSKSHSENRQRGSDGLGRGGGCWSREPTRTDDDTKEEDHLGAVGKGKGAGIPIHNAGDGSTQQDSLGREAGKAFLCDSSRSRSAGELPPTERRNRDSGLRSGPGKPCLTSLGPGKDLASPGLASGYRLPPLGVDADADIEMPDASREAG